MFPWFKNNVDAAIKLFSNNNPADTILREPFPVVKEKFNELSLKFKEKYPDVQSIDKLQSEYEKRDFVLAFREIIKSGQKCKSMKTSNLTTKNSSYQNKSSWIFEVNIWILPPG